MQTDFKITIGVAAVILMIATGLLIRGPQKAMAEGAGAVSVTNGSGNQTNGANSPVFSNKGPAYYQAAPTAQPAVPPVPQLKPQSNLAPQQSNMPTFLKVLPGGDASGLEGSGRISGCINGFEIAGKMPNSKLHFDDKAPEHPCTDADRHKNSVYIEHLQGPQARAPN